MRAVFLSFILALHFSSAALAVPALEPQNVIFITFDGVRYNDVYRPERDSVLLKPKKGFPLAKTQAWLKHHHGFQFGTQGLGDEMEVGNNSSVSLPGYKAIFSGLRETECQANDCPGPTQDTLVDSLVDEFKNPRDVALFSSWDLTRFATEGPRGPRAVQSLGRGGLKNFVPGSSADSDFMLLFDGFTTAAALDPPEWGNARKDQYTWEIATAYLKTYHPRFTYISLLDTDQHAHASDRPAYFKSLNDYDNQLMQLVQQLSQPEHAEYFKNTSIVITTDHGRGGDAWTFPWHGEVMLLGFVDGSENIWSWIVPSQAMQAHTRLVKSRHGVMKKYSQLDIRPTLELLLNIRVKKGFSRGQPLIKTGSKSIFPR